MSKQEPMYYTIFRVAYQCYAEIKHFYQLKLITWHAKANQSATYTSTHISSMTYAPGSLTKTEQLQNVSEILICKTRISLLI